VFHLIWAAALLLPLWLKPSPITYIGNMHQSAPTTTVMNRPRPEDAPSDSAWAAHCDSVHVAARRDSLEAGTVDPKTFTPEEFEQQKLRAFEIWYERREFIKELNGESDFPYDWT
jgi:hypothetical protein